MQFRVCYNC
nr:unnamed protein product [Callosobruchus analis]